MQFSVVIPVYNREDLIRTTVDSVLDQNRPNLDVIVVDDGSSDGTLSVLRSMQDSIRVFEQANAGAGAARNTGLRNARGEYVAFLDSDDLWFPWTVDCYEQIIRSQDRPAFVAGQPYLFSKEKEVENKEREDVEIETFLDYFASCDAWRWWGASSFVMRTDAVRRVGGFTERRDIISEDMDLTMRMGTEPGFVDVASGPTFAYREHDDQLTESVRKSTESIFHLIEQEKMGKYPGGESRRIERLRIITRHARSASLSCLKSNRKDRGWELYRQTWSWNRELGRWKYLFGFPVRALQQSLRLP